MPEAVVFTNMCMVYDQEGRVLALDRQDKNWGGVTFPGGHVERGESFTDAVVREIREETGLVIQSPQLCGVKQWPGQDGARHVVLCYKTDRFAGRLASSDEGPVFWVRREEFPSLRLASGMEYMLQLFFDERYSEHYLLWEDGRWRNLLK